MTDESPPTLQTSRWAVSGWDARCLEVTAVRCCDWLWLSHQQWSNRDWEAQLVLLRPAVWEKKSLFKNKWTKTPPKPLLKTTCREWEVETKWKHCYGREFGLCLEVEVFLNNVFCNHSAASNLLFFICRFADFLRY